MHSTGLARPCLLLHWRAHEKRALRCCCYQSAIGNTLHHLKSPPVPQTYQTRTHRERKHARRVGAHPAAPRRCFNWQRRVARHQRSRRCCPAPCVCSCTAAPAARRLCNPAHIAAHCHLQARRTGASQRQLVPVPSSARHPLQMAGTSRWVTGRLVARWLPPLSHLLPSFDPDCLSSCPALCTCAELPCLCHCCRPCSASRAACCAGPPGGQHPPQTNPQKQQQQQQSASPHPLACSTL